MAFARRFFFQGRAGAGALFYAMAGAGGLAGFAVSGPDVPAEAFVCYTSTRRTEAVVVAPDGVVWAAGEGGIVLIKDGRVVGVLTRQDGLPHNNVHRLAIGPAGEIWAATSGGVCVRKRGGWISYTRKHGLTDEYVSAIAVDKMGRVFAGTRAGICAYMPKQDRFAALDDVHEHARRCVHDIFPAQDGSVWFAKENGLTRFLPDGRWQTFRRDPMIATGRGEIVGAHIFAVVADQSGVVWIGTERGLGAYDGVTWRRFASGNSLVGVGGPACDFVMCLAADSVGRIWMGYGDSFDGIACVSNGVWRLLSTNDGFPSGRVHRITPDGNGLWMASDAGVFRVDERGIEHVAAFGDLPDNHVVSIWRNARGSILVQTGSGLVGFREGRRMTEEETAVEANAPVQEITGAVKMELKDHSMRFMAGEERSGGEMTLGGHDFPRWITAMCWESETIAWVGTACEGAIRMDFRLVKGSAGRGAGGSER